MANNGRFEYTIGFKTDTSGLKQAQKALQEIQNIPFQNYGDVNFEKINGQIADARKQALVLESAMNRAFNPKMGTMNLSVLRKELSSLNLNEIRETMAAIGPQGELAFNQVAAAAMHTNLQIKQGNTILEKFGRTLYRNVEWLLSGQLINVITKTFTQAYGFTKNLDASLNDIRIVTGKSADEMARYGEEAQKTAVALGKGTRDITEASLIYFQQGLTDEEVNARTEVTAKMANVSGQSADTVADQMTAIWNGFQVGNDELERYADIMTAIAASTASDSEELAGAISKVASIANITGVDMEQLSAMISTVISVTRESPETVGTAFKTIFARINDLVEDGTDEFGVSLGRVSSHLAAMGIEILNEDGTLKDLGVTLTEVGEKWSSYSREQQVAIAEQMGGKRQWGQVLSLFDNWDKYSDALDVARESTGALQEQQDIYMDRVETHLQELSDAWERVYLQIFNAKDLNTIIDAITEIINKVGEFLETVGGIKPVLKMIGTLMLQAFAPKIGQEITRIGGNIATAFTNRQAELSQRAILQQYGTQVQDSALIQELVDKHKEMMKYKQVMTKEDEAQFNAYLDQKVVLDHNTKELEKQLQTAKDFVASRPVLQASMQQAGGLDQEKFDTTSLNMVRSSTQTLLQGEALDTAVGKLSLSQDVGAFEAEKAKQLQQIEQYTIKLQEYRDQDIANAQTTEANRKKQIDGINKLLGQLDNYQRELSETTEWSDNLASSLRRQADSISTTTRNLEKRGTQIGAVLPGSVTSALLPQGNGFRNSLGSNVDAGQMTKDKYQALLNTLGDTTKQDIPNVFSQEQVDRLQKVIDKAQDMPTIVRAFRAELVATQTGVKQVDGVMNNHTEQQIENGRKVGAAWDETHKKMVGQKSIQQGIANIARFTGVVSQAAMAFNQFQNIGKIIKDEDIKDSEKMNQIFSSLIMTLPLLGSLLSQLGNSSFFTNFISGTKEQGKALWDSLQAQRENANAIKEVTKAEKELSIARDQAQKAQQKAQSMEATLEKADKITGKKRSPAKIQAEEEIKAKAAAIGATREEQQAALDNAKAKSAEAAATKQARTADYQEAVASQESAAANELQAKAAEKAAFAESAKNIAIAVGIAVIIAAVIAYKKIKEAQEELEETAKKNTEILQAHVQANQDLIKSNGKLLESFQDFDKVWDSFKQGKATIDEVRSSIEQLAEALGLTEDEEYLRLKRLAEYSGDYKDLADYLLNQKYQGIIQQTASAYQGTADFSRGVRENKLRTAETVGVHAGSNSDWGLNNLSNIFGDAFSEGNNRYFFKIDSMSLDEIEAADKELAEWIQNDKELTDDQKVILQSIRDQLAQYLPQTLEKSAEADAEIWKLFSGEREAPIFAGESGNRYIPGTNILKPENNLLFSFSGFTFDENTTEEQIQEQLNNFAKFYQQYQKEAGKIISYEDAYKTGWNWFMQTQVGAEDALTSIDYKNSLRDSINETIDEVNESAKESAKDSRVEVEVIPQINEGTLNEIEEQLKGKGLNLVDIDWEKVKQDTGLLEGLTDGKISGEDIEKLSQYRKQVSYLTQDYQALQSTLDSVIKSVEKGSSTQSKILSSKDFEAILDAQDELINLYGKDSDVAEAYDTIAKAQAGQISVYSENFKEALKEIKAAAADAEIEKALQNFQFAAKIAMEVASKSFTGATHTVEELAESLDNLISADYAIEIAINAKYNSEYEELKSDFSKLTDAASKIGENFVVDTSDMDALAETFPGILEGAQVYTDGTVHLNEKIARSAMDTAKAELDAEKDSLINRLELRKEELQRKIAIYNDIYTAADDVINAEGNSEKDLTKLQNSLGQLKVQNDFEVSADRGEIDDNYFQQMEDNYTDLGVVDAAFWKQVSDNQKAARTGEGEVYNFTETETWKQWKNTKIGTDKGPGKDDTSTGGFEGISNFEDIFDTNKWIGSDEEWKKVQVLAEQIRESAKNARDSLMDEVTGIDATISKIRTIGTSTTQVLSQVGKAKKDKSTEAKEAEAQLLELLYKEKDAYHDINIEIQKTQNELKRLQDIQKQATGKTLLQNLQQQIDTYGQLSQQLETLHNQQLDDLNMRQQTLANQGVEFDVDGTITNYNTAWLQLAAEVNQDIEWFNSLSAEEQEAYEDWIKERQDAVDQLKTDMDDYENLRYQEIVQTEENLREAVNTQLELRLQLLVEEIQITVDKGTLKRTELEISKIKNRLQDTDILGNLTYDAQILFSYRDSGEEKALKDRYEKLKAIVEDARLKGEDLDKSTLDAFKTAQDEYLKYIQEAAERTVKIITDVFDRLDKRIERQKTQIETINKIFEHDMNLVRLRYGDSAYQQLTTLYEARERVSKVQLQNAQVRIQAIQQALQQARENNLGDDVIQQYEDQLASALESQRQTIDDYLNLVKEKATNAIDEVFAHLDEQLAGTSLEEVKIEWDWTNRDTDDYYDTINAAYELEKLRNQMRKAINETDDVATQKALNDLMNDELEQLQQKDKLSKYDIERANVLFDIEQKRAAFREAQNNKSKMRLRRDSSGNYSYQFVSDEDRVTSAMQDLADAQNSLYNIDKEAYKNNLDKMYEYYEEFAQKMREAVKNGATEEELLKIQENYATRLGDLQQELYEKANNLEQVVLNERQRMTGESWEELAVIERDVLMGDIVPTWNTALAAMMQNPDLQKFLQLASAEAIDIAQGATATIEATIQTNIGTSLEDLVNGADPAVDAISRMTESVVSLETELSRLVTILSSMSGITLEGEEVLQDITNSGKQYADGIIGLITGNQTTLDNTLQTTAQGWINLISQAHQNTTETTERTIGTTAIHRREYPDTTQARIDYLKMVEQYKENIQNLVKALNLNEPIAAIDSRIAALNKTNSQAMQPNYITNNIQADFPAVNSAQEIQMALEMLMNQATQSAFNTLK